MATVYVPPPSADEIMDMMATWVARLYGVKITVTVVARTGESTTVIDGRPQHPGLGDRLNNEVAHS